MRSSIALCSRGIPLASFAPSRALVAIALCSCDVPRATLALSRGPINDRVTIVIGLLLLSACHRCRAVIVALSPMIHHLRLTHGLHVSICDVVIGTRQPAATQLRATPRAVTRISVDITVLLAPAIIFQHPHHHRHYAPSCVPIPLPTIASHHVQPPLFPEGNFIVRPLAPRVRASG